MSSTKPQPPPTALAIWWLIPLPVRLALRARVPLSTAAADGMQGLLVAVGSGVPLRLLHVAGTDSGELAAALYELRRTGTREVAAAVVGSDGLPQLLQRWAREFLT